MIIKVPSTVVSGDFNFTYDATKDYYINHKKYNDFLNRIVEEMLGSMAINVR